jgi:hypothetical protein
LFLKQLLRLLKRFQNKFFLIYFLFLLLWWEANETDYYIMTTSSSFLAVNVPLPQADETSTLHRNLFIDPPSVDSAPIPEDTSKTPTRNSFNSMTEQKPLPEIQSNEADSPMETKMEIEDDIENGDATQNENEAGSPHDSTDPDGKKKKKATRFFCTGYPPCKLSFTRSEHLARHIRYVTKINWQLLFANYFRKHTGERPFQCHCGRRFSRLDNLRQHAQTVHINEDIPISSPAATGARYQRHVRTERVRTPGRARSNTYSAAINPAHQARGHSRNLSTSSIMSSASSITYTSDEFRRLGLETPRLHRLSLDTPPPSAGPTPLGLHGYMPPRSPSGFSTPTSSTFSMGASSPRYSGSSLHTPASSIYHRTVMEKQTDRRLSAPGSNFTSTESRAPSYMSPVPSHAALSRAGSQYASPIPASANLDPQADNDPARRRTWHPNTSTGLGRPNSSGGLPQLALPHRPLFASQLNHSPTNSGVRLPGIETFDNLNKVPPPAGALIRRQPSPMELDPPPTSHAEEESSKRDSINTNRSSWTASIRERITGLDLSPSREQQPPMPQPWTQGRPGSFHSRSQSETLPVIPSQPEEEEESAPVVIDAKRARRMGWYMQPPSSSGPSTSATTSTSLSAEAQAAHTLQHAANSQHSVLHQQQIQLRTSPETASTNSSDGAPTPPVLAAASPTIANHSGAMEGIEIQGHYQPVEEHKGLPAITNLLNTPPQSATHAPSGFGALLPAPTQQPQQVQQPTFRSGYPQSNGFRSSLSATPFGLPKVSESEGLTFGSPTAAGAEQHFQQQQHQHSNSSNGMDRLEALVAVATREA